MECDFANLLSADFAPLSEVKARLSEKIRAVISGSRRTVITTNGRPTAVLLSYRDYLLLLKKLPETPPESSGRVLDLKEWRKARKKRAAVRDSIVNLFDPSSLSRKGQKTYKREMVRRLGK